MIKRNKHVVFCVLLWCCPSVLFRFCFLYVVRASLVFVVLMCFLWLFRVSTLDFLRSLFGPPGVRSGPPPLSSDFKQKKQTKKRTNDQTKTHEQQIHTRNIKRKIVMFFIIVLLAVWCFRLFCVCVCLLFQCVMCVVLVWGLCVPFCSGCVFLFWFCARVCSYHSLIIGLLQPYIASS